MRKALFILLIANILSFTGCNNERTGKDKNSSEISGIPIRNQEFQKYVQSLDIIPLPLNHSPIGKFPALSKNYNKPGFEKFKHVWTSKPLGLLYKNDQSIVTIELSIGDVGFVPFIVSYDLNGNKVDSLGPYEKSGQDMGYEAIEYLTITDDRLISVIDTVKRWKLNNNQTDILEDSLTITTGQVLYKILENGKINKEK